VKIPPAALQLIPQVAKGVFSKEQHSHIAAKLNPMESGKPKIAQTLNKCEKMNEMYRKKMHFQFSNVLLYKKQK
jgi:hypothetical protein